LSEEPPIERSWFFEAERMNIKEIDQWQDEQVSRGCVGGVFGGSLAFCY
jgi:hypothetical protein